MKRHASARRDGSRESRALSPLPSALRATKAPFKRLMLGENVNVAAAGAKALAAAAAASPTLTALHLSKATIGVEGAKALGVALTETRGLRVLELAWCKLRADGARHVAEGLRRNATLARLGLARNSLGDKGVFELVSGGLESCRCLRELDLRHNAIGPEGAKRLVAMMEKKNFVLAALEMAGNKLDAAEEAALVALAGSARTKPAPKVKAASHPARPALLPSGGGGQEGEREREEGDENKDAGNEIAFTPRRKSAGKDDDALLPTA